MDPTDSTAEEVVVEEITPENLGQVVYADPDQGMMITVDPSQHNYSIPVTQHQYGLVIENVQSEVVMDNVGVSENTITPYVSHHDYISTMAMEPVDNRNPGGHSSLQQNLVIEEAVDQEIVTQSNQDLIKSKPLTAMYLQATGPVSRDSIYIPGQSGLSISPLKYTPGTSFDMRSSQHSGQDISCGEDLVDENGDGLRIKFPYNSGSCMYNSSIGDLQLKIEPDTNQLLSNDKSKMDSQRSVGAILAASEAIKHQDIASEVEIGTCEVEISSPKQKGKKRKGADRKDGIDDDIEQIRKAAKTVAYTLKGMSKPEKEVRKRRKPRIKLTLTKATKRGRPQSTFVEEDEDDDDMYESNIRPRKKRKSSDRPDVIYQCEYCEKQFKSREKVKCHAKIHTEDRNFVCQECGTRFKRREHLVRHYRRHTNDRPYECMECGKAYFRLESLKRHSYLHTGEKPFECSVCEMAFSRHDRLIKHSLVHDK